MASRLRWAASGDTLNYYCLIFQGIFDIFHTNSNAFVQRLPRNKAFVLFDVLTTILVQGKQTKGL